MKKVNKS